MYIISRAFFSFVIAVFFVTPSLFAAGVDDLTNAFLSVANDPTGKSTDSNQKVQILQGFVKGTRTQGEALSTLNAWNVNLHLSSYQTPVQDADGNNIAHKLLERSDISVEDMVKLTRIFGNQIWSQKNKDGLTPFEVHPEKLKIALQEKNQALYVSNQKLWDFLTELDWVIKPALLKVLGNDFRDKIYNEDGPGDLISALKEKRLDIEVKRQIAEEEQQKIDADVETLRAFMNDETTSIEAIGALMNLSEHEDIKPTILALRDSYGNNLAHKFLEQYYFEGCNAITILLNYFNGIKLFDTTNEAGLTPIAAHPNEFVSCVLSPLLDSNRQPYPDTSLERQQQIKLQELLKDAAQNYVTDVVEKLVEKNDEKDKGYEPNSQKSEEIYQIVQEISRIVPGFIKAYGPEIKVPLEKIPYLTFYRQLFVGEIGVQERQKVINYMLEYRVEGKSLYSYFSKNESIEDVSHILPILFPLYFKDRTPTADEVDIQRLDDLYWIQGLIDKHDSEEALKNYKNTNGENLAAIALRNHNSHLFQELVKAFPELLRETSSNGLSPLMLVASGKPKTYYDYDAKKAYASFYDYLVLKTPSLAQYEDQYGNTASRLHEFAQSSDPMSLFKFFANMFKSKKLDNDLWKQILDNPYLRVLEMDKDSFEFVTLYSVMNQTQTLTHRSFLQQSLEIRDEANKLWRGLFTTLEQRIPEEHRIPKASRDGMSEIHDAVKALMFASNAQEQIERLGLKAQPELKILQDLQSKILSTGGTFGMNFNRSANREEVEIMIQSLQFLGRSMGDPSKIIDSLFVQYPSALTKDQQEKLDDHQINCAVIALRDVVGVGRTDEIDRLLKAKLPGVRINSAERFDKIQKVVMDLSLRRNSFDGSGFFDGSDFDEEY